MGWGLSKGAERSESVGPGSPTETSDLIFPLMNRCTARWGCVAGGVTPWHNTFSGKGSWVQAAPLTVGKEEAAEAGVAAVPLAQSYSHCTQQDCLNRKSLSPWSGTHVPWHVCRGVRGQPWPLAFPFCCVLKRSCEGECLQKLTG